MKMLTTQVAGLLQRIAANQEESIEETARLLAQATVGEGHVYMAAFGEMEALYVNASASELFPSLAKWTPESELTSADRVWILAPRADHPEALALARELSDRFIPFSALTADKVSDENELSELAYTYVSLGFAKGLLPTDTGERVVLPYALAGLFVYEAVLLEVRDMTLAPDELE